jgi:pyrroline-5-carboxylate reductase
MDIRLIKIIKMKIGIVGMGNMGRAIHNALCINYDVSGFGKFDDNADLVNCDYIFLAVKPQMISELELPTLDKNQVVISILAGTSLQKLRDNVDAISDCSLVRMMPNLCAAVGRSNSCYYIEDGLSREKTIIVQNMFESFGNSLRLDSEEDFAVSTSIFGCGPANFLYILSAMKEFGEDKGITEAMLLELMESTAIWAKKQGKDFETLISNVKSKGGTTEKIHETWDSNGLRDLLIEGLRSGELKEESGDY